jgi:hypothetical protein
MVFHFLSRCIFIVPIFLFLISCQKDDDFKNSKEANICPEVAMKNYEEVGVIINQFFDKHTTQDIPKSLTQLTNYLEGCGCVEKVIISSGFIYTDPSIREYNVRFVGNEEFMDKVIDIFINNDNKLEVRRIHD